MIDSKQDARKFFCMRLNTVSYILENVKPRLTKHSNIRHFISLFLRQLLYSCTIGHLSKGYVALLVPQTN